MRDWYRTATVRTGSPPPASGTGAPFDAALLPVDDPPPELLRRTLGRYLHATHVLELRVVNPVAASIALDDGPFHFDDLARLDAHKVYCDEGYHALLAAELIDRLTADVDVGEPVFLARLRALETRADPALVRFLFAVVTETVVSAQLVALARGQHLQDDVRAFVSDHARDEAWHASFFAARFAGLWGALTDVDRDRLGPLLPDLVVAFLAPDVDALSEDLAAVGLDVDVDVGLDVGAARPTLRCFDRAGALRPYAEHFEAAGLL